MLVHEGFQQGDDLVLLVARQLGGGIENLTELSAGVGDAALLRFAKHFLDGHAENPGHGQQELGFGDAAVLLSCKDIGMAGAELAGQFAHGQTGLFTQHSQVDGMLSGIVHGRKVNHCNKKSYHSRKVNFELTPISTMNPPPRTDPLPIFTPGSYPWDHWQRLALERG